MTCSVICKRVQCRYPFGRLTFWYAKGNPVSNDWIYGSARQLLQSLQKGEISSRELLESSIARIERFNPELNAVVANDFANARQRADDADAARAKGESWGPLHGLPITVKDTYEVPGMPCTAGAS